MEWYASTVYLVLVTLGVLNHGIVSQSPKRLDEDEQHQKTCDFRWSVWSEFSPCSRSCGLGMKSRHRTCYEYGPQASPVHGDNCKGRTRDYQACNTQACPPGSRDFRELQCSFFNGQQYKQHGHQWTAVNSGDPQGNTNPCALMCAAEGHSGLVVKFSQRVVDGTQCQSTPNSVCVAGTCVPIGCDNRPYSNKTVDRCGVCTGRNNTCHTVTRRISHRVPSGYTELLRIPVGTRHLRVTERPRSGVILSLKDARDVFVINGRHQRDHRTKTRVVAGTIVYYSHAKRGLEDIRAEGPFNETIILVGSARKASVVSLVYEYTIPKRAVSHARPHKTKAKSDASYPWQSLLYQNVLTGRGMFGPTPPAHRSPTASLITSTVKPSCRGHVDGGRKSEAPGIDGQYTGYTHSPKEQKRFLVKKDHSRSQVHTANEPNSGHSNRNNRHHRLSMDSDVPNVQKRGSGRPVPMFRGVASLKRKHSNIEPFSSMFKLKTSRSVFYSPTHSRTRGTSSRRTFQTVPNQKHIPKHGLKLQTGSSQSHTSSNKPSKQEIHSIQKETSQPDVESPSTRTSLSEQSLREAVTTARNAYVTLRTPIEESMPTYMPGTEKQEPLKEDLTIYSGTDSKDKFEENSDLKVNVSVQIAARKSQKAEKKRRGRERGRKRKKDEKNRMKYIWRANGVTPCTSTCEVGTELTLFSCHKSTGVKVNDALCDPATKPTPNQHVCASETCKPRWVAGLWSECSKSCGEGRQLRSARCWQMMALGFDSTVRDFTCEPSDKPQTVRSCHKLASCIPQWEMSAWEGCSTECGYGVQLRHVRCSADDVSACSARKRPLDRRPCRNKPCVNQWYTLPWSSCSGMCGIRKRKVYCRDNQGRVVDDRKCNHNTKPLTAHACGRCKNKWVPQEWGECSATCGDGVTSRRVVCGTSRNGRFHIRPDSFCVKEVRPPTTTSCRTTPCGATWYTTDWSECSETCGTTSKHYRDVRCYGGPETELCDANTRPEARDRCKLPPCETGKVCEDDGDTRCDLVVSAKLCSHKYYRKACCLTCYTHDG